MLFKSIEAAVDDYTSEAFDAFDADDVEGLILNRPGFPRGLFVQNSGGFFKSIHLCMEFIPRRFNPR